MPEPPITIAQARLLYGDSDTAHAFDHVLRVTRLAEHIAVAEGADVHVVFTAGLLHDCARKEPDHHLAGARRARALLSAEDPAFVEAVAHCIEAHSFSYEPHPATLEAQCLADADRLDAIGAIGIARVFAYAGRHNTQLWSLPLAEVRSQVGDDVQSYRQRRGEDAAYTPSHEFICKLDALSANLYTAAARAIAGERRQFMAAFFARLDAEALCEC